MKDQQEIFGECLFEKTGFRKIDFEFQNNYVENGSEMKKQVDSEKECYEHASDLKQLNELMLKCHKCPLEKTRNNLVFGTGDPNAKVMVVGEAPGAEEDLQGKPFVGRAGKLLTDILKAINFSREEVYITNTVKCRPPGNRNPSPEEMAICYPYLERQIELIQPKLILCLGLIAASGVLKLKLPLGKMRGNVYEYGNAKVMVTYHPAALLRNPQWKRGTWEDVQKFRKLYDELVIK
ncbi:MAG: uracil-DNA glycosylase [Bacteroidota bacterium]|nr:uracil-DNA glycosylase [Bacteroidota bacterium]MDP4191855.1 uracil-DNA glycosylase [Bacteroidota bacterium]MDP4195454.1 uracil-DNA glycosylase [Bacteroidota bacterium]